MGNQMVLNTSQFNIEREHNRISGKNKSWLYELKRGHLITHSKETNIKEKYTRFKFKLVVCEEGGRYIFQLLEGFIKKINEITIDKVVTFFSQTFPNKVNYVGKEIIKSPNHLKKILQSSFKLEYFCTEWSYTYNGNLILHILLKKEVPNP